MKKNDYTNKSIQQAIEIVHTIADSREPIGISEISRAAGIPRDATFRACATMESEGWLVKVGDRYKLGGKLPHLWARYKAKLESERDSIGRELQELEVAGE